MVRSSTYPLSEGSLCFGSAPASSLCLLGLSSLLRSLDLYPLSFSLYLSLHSGVKIWVAMAGQCSGIANPQARAFDASCHFACAKLKTIDKHTCFYSLLVVSLCCCFFLSVAPCSYFCYAPCYVPSQYGQKIPAAITLWPFCVVSGYYMTGAGLAGKTVPWAAAQTGEAPSAACMASLQVQLPAESI